MAASSGQAADRRPAFYAAAGRGWWRDWWTLLHPPYTAWLLAYVVIGATLSDRIDWLVFGGGLVAFFLAVGVSAHALDELQGRPLRTEITARTLVGVAAVALAAAAGIGIALVSRVGWILVPFIAVGVALVVAYNLELFGGLVHTDIGFALAWGAFPLLVGYVAQARTVTVGPVLLAVAAAAISYAQRALSTPARMLRRRVDEVAGELRLPGGDSVQLSVALLLAPLEAALRWLSYAMVFLAAGLAVVRWS